MMTLRSRLVRTTTTVLLALLIGATSAACGGGGPALVGTSDGDTDGEPPPQGLLVQCGLDAPHPIHSLEIVHDGTSTMYPVDLLPGRETYVPLPAGTYELYVWWQSEGNLWTSIPPRQFRVYPHEITVVTWTL